MIKLLDQFVKENERIRKAQQRQIAADAKRAKSLYEDSYLTLAAQLNSQTQKELVQLDGILSHAVNTDNFLNLDALKLPLEIPVFDPGADGSEPTPPVKSHFIPTAPGVLKKILPWTARHHQIALKNGREEYRDAVEAHKSSMADRKRRLAQSRAAHLAEVKRIKLEVAAQHQLVEAVKAALASGDSEAVVSYFSAALARSEYSEKFPATAKVAYVPESKQLAVEYELPPFQIVPHVKAYKYVKTKNSISETVRSSADCKKIYSRVICQIALRTLFEVFETDRRNQVESVVFNGHVSSVDAATGKNVRPCVISVRTTRMIFDELDLRRVDPVACLTGLNASISKKPDELIPIRPVLEFSMVDSRFVQEADVLSGLDSRPNLMELTPSEFESLITNLFQRMGLETRQTQASRDGGVDCVAFDPRPIFGGKVVIQAKRYKNTVGVSAVRDLYGTLQNEGASKGILVTTSGYGKASFEFADGKPIELLSGSNLLYLLAEHAGIEGKIVMPEDWKDPVPDS